MHCAKRDTSVRNASQDEELWEKVYLGSRVPLWFLKYYHFKNKWIVAHAHNGIQQYKCKKSKMDEHTNTKLHKRSQVQKSTEYVILH